MSQSGSIISFNKWHFKWLIDHIFKAYMRAFSAMIRKGVALHRLVLSLSGDSTCHGSEFCMLNQKLTWTNWFSLRYKLDFIHVFLVLSLSFFTSSQSCFRTALCICASPHYGSVIFTNYLNYCHLGLAWHIIRYFAFRPSKGYRILTMFLAVIICIFAWPSWYWEKIENKVLDFWAFSHPSCLTS